MHDILPPPPQGSGDRPSGRSPAASGADASDGLPARFGKYTLLRKLATGGMAELFLALQKSVAGFEKLIVIKRILPQMTQDAAFIDMLLGEARIAATLSHPNIVQIFDVGQVDGTYFIAMEHVHGEDIRSIVRAMKAHGLPEFPVEHALGIVLGMCAGLAYAHEKRDLDGSALNIVHRDISPQNVVVTFSGDVKIVDFGIAKSDSKLNHETRSGKLKGKVPYMSPEQARGEKLDQRSDIFATGVMLFELTTGKRLFKGQSEYETLKLICDREYPLPSAVRPGYPAELERIVVRALAKDRNERFQSAREMQGALEEFVRGERIAVSTIALNHFMQGLFEDKLATQKEALLQGKALADIIEMQRSDPPPSEMDMRSSQAPSGSGPGTLSMPAASRTVTDVAIRRARTQGSLPWIAVSAVLLLLVGVGVGGAFWYTKQQRAKALLTTQATQLPPVQPNRGALEIKSNPPGAAIWIDGDMRSEVTPATIMQLPTGRPVDVRLTMDGFEAEKQVVTMPDDTRGKVTSVDVTLKKGSVSLDVAVLPATAKPVLVVDGKHATGLVVDGLASGDQHKVIVSAPGFVEQSIVFLGAPQEKKHLDVTLVKEQHRTGHATTSNNTSAPVGNGKLNVATNSGWCNVAVDGANKGATPVAGLEL
ncbi:MAG: Serine/threonine protein kinase PrkC, regulator of stationary phase, partial [Myxococcaceae bacterium]|nr:Serine/threonine protein kinase PrkC, regulator of stationary phase [Myxococcaceae bacterium]